MRDLRALKKKPTHAGCFDDIPGRFLALVMARLLAREFDQQYIFAKHPAWKNGPWKAKDSEPCPAVALGTADGELSAAIEIESPRSLIVDPKTSERWKHFATSAYLDLVVPTGFLAKTVVKLTEAGVSPHDIWTYTVDRSNQVRVVRMTSNPEPLLKRAGINANIVVC